MVLETEVLFVLLSLLFIQMISQASNKAALGLYSKLGFMKEEKLGRYYLNGGDAFRLKLIIDKNPYVSTEQI